MRKNLKFYLNPLFGRPNAKPDASSQQRRREYHRPLPQGGNPSHHVFQMEESLSRGWQSYR